MKIINLTPHIIRLNNGAEYAPSGKVARVSTSYSEFEDGICSAKFGQVQDLPEATVDTLFVVSGMVASATKRMDVVAPATGHPECIRKDGQIWSVPGFVRG